MLVITAVNGCTYCEWFHAKMAVSSGMKQNEINDMLNLQFKTNAKENEIPALIFAQHYSETNRNPDEKMRENFYDFYGEKMAANLMMHIRAITFGNLIGNTFDAFISRLKGKKAKESNFFSELIIFLFSVPFLVPMIPFMKNK